MNEAPTKYPREAAIAVARELCNYLKPVTKTDRLIVAGSLRRGKPEVKDVEIVFVPEWDWLQNGGLFKELVDASAWTIERLVERGIIAKRPKCDGTLTWGEQNKLAIHVSSGIPVDLFATNEESWWSYVVCRTGGKENNIAIAKAAQARGLQWNPYGPGFTNLETGELWPVTSEKEVFERVGLPYIEPYKRK